MSIYKACLLVPAVLLGTLVLPTPALADGVWDPPGADDPCGSPTILCADPLDPANWTGPGTQIGNKLEEDSNKSAAHAFIWWVANTFGPRPPQTGGQPPSDDPPAEPPQETPPGGEAPPSGGGTDTDESPTVRDVSGNGETRLVLTNAKLVMKLRRFLNKKKEGKMVRIAGKRYRLAYKREKNPKAMREFVAVLVPLNSPVKTRAKALTVRGAGNKLYLSAVR